MQGFTGSFVHLEVSCVGIVVREAMQRDQCHDESGEVMGDVLDTQLISTEAFAQ
jgi:hypothetical protein